MKCVREIITKLRHDAILCGLHDDTTRANNEATYLPILYKGRELEKLGLRGLGVKFRRLVLDRFQPRLSDAFAIVDTKSGKPINHSKGDTSRGPFRFDDAASRDAYYATFLAQNVVA